jgi:hypothetical protein
VVADQPQNVVADADHVLDFDAITLPGIEPRKQPGPKARQPNESWRLAKHPAEEANPFAELDDPFNELLRRRSLLRGRA